MSNDVRLIINLTLCRTFFFLYISKILYSINVNDHLSLCVIQFDKNLPMRVIRRKRNFLKATTLLFFSINALKILLTGLRMAFIYIYLLWKIILDTKIVIVLSLTIKCRDCRQNYAIGKRYSIPYNSPVKRYGLLYRISPPQMLQLTKIECLLAENI